MSTVCRNKCIQVTTMCVQGNIHLFFYFLFFYMLCFTPNWGFFLGGGVRIIPQSVIQRAKTYMSTTDKNKDIGLMPLIKHHVRALGIL